MTKAVALSGSNPDLLVRLGQMHLELGDFTRAGENADAALRSRRADPTAWALKADIYRGVGRTEEAIDCYQRAMVYRPDWPEVQVTVAELYRLTNRPQRALATLDRMSDQRSETQVPPRTYLVRSQAWPIWVSAKRRSCACAAPLDALHRTKASCCTSSPSNNSRWAT